MIDFSKPHNLLGLAVVILLVGFAVNQAAKRFQPARTVAAAAGYTA